MSASDAAIRVGASARLDESGKPAVASVDDEDFGVAARAGVAHAAGKRGFALLGEERAAHAEPFGPIGVAIRANEHGITNMSERS